MKIAIINITGGGISGGYKKYLQNIIPRIAVHPVIEVVLCASPKTIGVQNWFGSLSNVQFIDCQPFRFLRNRTDLKLKQCLESFAPDLIFIPIERFFRFNNVPVVSMVRNMEPLVEDNGGNPISEIIKNWFRAYYAKKAVKKSDRIIAISNFVKEFLIKKWDVSEKKIGLVYHGINNLGNEKPIKPAKIPVDWREKFIFTAGSIRPARGLEDILKATQRLNLESKEPIKLVIAGDASSGMVKYNHKLKKWIKKHGVTDNVYWAGNLSENEMVWCYQNCKVFIMSSRVESFGQTALEAMSQGCVCISADNPCLPEIFKDAAVYYRPKDSDSLVKTIKSVFEWDSNQKEKMAESARKRASEFSWDICAKRTVEELNKVVNNRKIK